MTPVEWQAKQKSEDVLIRDAFAGGISAKELANRFDRTTASIYNALARQEKRDGIHVPRSNELRRPVDEFYQDRVQVKWIDGYARRLVARSYAEIAVILAEIFDELVGS